jgi:hypothetical protein
LAQLSAGAGGLAGPPAGDGVGTEPWVRAHVPARRGGDGVSGVTGGKEAVRGGENRSPVKFRDGSSSVTRFCADGVVVRHEQR